MRIGFLLVGMLGLLHAFAPPLASQTVRGVLLEEGSEKPIRGSLLVLLDSEGNQRSRALSDEQGNFVLQANAPGRYTLRTDRIGFRSTVTPTFELRAGETVQRRILASLAALQLEAITVGARRRCTIRPADGLAVATLWEEARKALNAADFTQDQGLYRFRVRRYERDLDLESLRITRDSARTRTEFSDNPFVSLPAEQLLTGGFVQKTDTGTVYAAPDAQVLLSDEFLDAYCFRLAQAPRGAEGLVGLSFEPAARRGPPAVRGTLWLDRTSLELRFMEYGYTRVTLPAGPVERLGGRVEFEALPSGSWIVRSWWIRMPQVQERYAAWMPAGQRMQQVIDGIREEGGEIQEVVAVDGRLVRVSAPASVSGVVYDSAAAAPLAGAVVSLVGTEHIARTDSAGRYALENLSEGEFSLVFGHPTLDRYRISPEPRGISVRPGARLVADLGVAADARAQGIASVCPATEAPRERGLDGVLIGEVRDSLTGTLLGGAQVAVSWSAYRADGAAIPERWETVRTEADARGAYVACWVRSDRPLTVRAVHGQRRGSAERIPGLPTTRLAEQDLTIAVTPPSRVLIRLVELESGRSIAGAVVEIPASGLQGRTNQRGLLRFGAVAPGVQSFVVRHPLLGPVTKQ